ncbi:hypothetical protein [Bradyrhizobium sp. CCBAU 53338]|uniref:hypothetical protein n=1 Tax=Bradyrhizobium sp. CCBAU 53338 TaxID=1325111 RepID=UPI001FEF3455|nr:hypothetical protein [Bradyrhizobium sp. CCBAU 53338]
MTRASVSPGLNYSALAPLISPHEQINLLLLDALQKLADAGEVDAACRIAGKACVILRRSAPKDERRFNALLHRLLRKL